VSRLAIRAAQVFENGEIHCFNGDGQKTAVIDEPSVKAFIATNLAKGRISETTKIYLPKQASVEITTVRELKKKLGIGSFWRNLFGN